MTSNVRRLPFLNRITSEPLRKSAEACFALADALTARRAELDKSNKFTNEGKSAELADALRQEFAPKLRAVQRPIVTALEEVDRRTRALALPAPDPSNVVAELQRQELRKMLREMPLAERSALALSTKDGRITEAILSAPAELSGLPPDRFETLMNLQRERLHGPAVADIAKLKADIDEAMMCVEVATGEMQRNSGIAEDQFSKIVGNRQQGAPWLRHDGDRVVVVRPGEATYPPATAQEVATGKFYTSHSEYLADRHRGVAEAAA